MRAVAISHDGRLAVTVSSDKSACLWEVATGRQIRRFIGHDYWVTDVAFSPDDRFVVTGSDDTTARLWDIRTGAQVNWVKLGLWIWGVEFSPDGKFVLLSSPNQNITALWDLTANRLTTPFTGDLSTFTPNGNYVLADIDGLPKTINTRTREELPQSGPETTVVAPHNGLVLFTRLFDGLVRLSELEASRIKQIERKVGRVRLLKLSSNKKFLLTVSRKPDTVLWNVATGQQIKTFDRSNLYGHEVIFSPDGKLVLAPEKDAAIFYDAETGKEVRRLQGHQKDRVWSMDVSPDGRLILTGSLDGSARLWDTSRGKIVEKFPWSSEGMSSVAFSPSGRFLLIGSNDKTAHLFELASGKDVTFGEHSSSVTVVAFSPDEQFILTGTKDGVARILNVNSGAEEWKLESLGRVSSGSFSADGNSILLGNGEGTATLWDRRTRNKLRSFEGNLKFTSTIAMGANNQLYRHDTPTALSPDGDYVLTAHMDHNAKLWNGKTGEFIRYFEGHTQIVNSVLFSPDGKTILTGSDDGTARLWDRDTGRELRRFEQGQYGVSAVRFSAKDELVVTGGGPLVKLTRTATGKELCNLILLGDENWLVTGPDGRFDTNDIEGIRHLNWVMPDDPLTPLPLEIFTRDYFQPKLLARIFKDPPFDPIPSIGPLESDSA